MASDTERAGIRELRQHASRYVDLAAEGHTIDITNRGRVVARLVPAIERTGPLADLIETGVVRPPEDDRDVLDLRPAAPTGGMSLSEALQAMRDDERW